MDSPDENFHSLEEPLHPYPESFPSAPRRSQIHNNGVHENDAMNVDEVFSRGPDTGASSASMHYTGYYYPPPIPLDSPWTAMPRYQPPGSSTLSTPTPFSPFSYSPYYHAPPTPYYHIPLPANISTTNLPSTPEVASSLEQPSNGELSEMENRFSEGLFRGVFPGKHHALASRPSRAEFRWDYYGDTVTDGDRAQVLVNCMRRVGFETLGHALQVLFRHETFSEHQSVSTTVANFLHQESRFHHHHPQYIIYDLILKHPHATIQNAPPTNFDLPRYALPPSQRLCNRDLHNPNITTRSAMLDRSLQLVLKEIDSEAESLLTWDALLRPPMTSLKWKNLLSWNMLSVQERVATQAPVLFACLATVGVGKAARKKLDRIDNEDIGTESEGTDAQASENEDEEQDDDQDSTAGVPKSSLRDPWLTVTIFILTLLHLRYRFANLFPTLISVYLFSCNTHRDIISLLSHLGISLSYSGVLSTLHILADDAKSRLRALGQKVQHAPPTFQIVFDNVNKMRRSWEQKLGTQDEVQSGTAATIVMLRNVDPEVLNAAKLEEQMAEGGRKNMTFDVLDKDINWPHVHGIGRATVLRTWIKHIPALGRFRDTVEDLFTSTYAIHRLPPEKSEIYTMETSNINESTYKGVKEVLFNLVIKQMQVIEAWVARWVWFVAGDQLTIDRLRQLRRMMSKSKGFQRHTWVLPIIQLWHLKWNWQKAIFRLHWWPELGKGVFGLHYDTKVLGRDKFNPDRGDFYPSHALLEDRFETMLLEILRLLCEEDTGQTYSSSMNLLDIVESYFSTKGPLNGCDYVKLETLADRAYQRYMVSSAYEAALGVSERSEDIYGPDVSTDSDSESDLEEETVQQLPKPKKKTRGRKGKTQTTDNKSGGDQALANTIAFLRCTFWYLELCAAISEGDIGRVFEVIKLLRFSFWGTGSTNYGNELLELACNFLYDYPKDLLMAIFDNYLVNLHGKPGMFSELDLLQEHHNFLIKVLFNAKSYLFDSKHLAESISLNVRGFKVLKDAMPSWLGLKGNSGSHTNPKKTADINKLGHIYRRFHLMSWTRNRAQRYLVQDEFMVGRDILAGGKLAEFVERTLKRAGDVSGNGEEE